MQWYKCEPIWIMHFWIQPINTIICFKHISDGGNTVAWFIQCNYRALLQCLQGGVEAMYADVGHLRIWSLKCVWIPICATVIS